MHYNDSDYEKLGKSLQRLSKPNRFGTTERNKQKMKKAKRLPSEEDSLEILAKNLGRTLRKPQVDSSNRTPGNPKRRRTAERTARVTTRTGATKTDNLSATGGVGAAVPQKNFQPPNPNTLANDAKDGTISPVGQIPNSPVLKNRPQDSVFKGRAIKNPAEVFKKSKYFI